MKMFWGYTNILFTNGCNYSQAFEGPSICQWSAWGFGMVGPNQNKLYMSINLSIIEIDIYEN